MATRKVADLWLRKVLETLYQRRTVTRNEIVDATALNLASVSHATRVLLRNGMIVKMGDLQTDGGGRRREIFTLNGEAAYFVAVDLEGQRIRFALLNAKSDIRYRWEESLEWTESLDVGKLISGISRVLRNLDPEQRRRVIAVGLSYPGLLDENGRLTAVNLGWHGFPFMAELGRIATESDVSELPMFLVSHRDSTVLAERSLGAARECDEGLLIFGQRGIGMGIFAGGRTVVGWRKMAGEIGHITIDPSSDQVCRCGKRGCLETVASVPSIARRYLERTGDPASERAIHISGIFDRARAGEPAAVEVVRDAGRAIGLALSHAISILNPKTIILSGDFAAGEEILVPFVREEIERNTIPVLLQGVTIVCSSLGLDVRLKGAGAFAFNSAITDPALLNRMCSSVLRPPEKAQISRV